jgi:Zn-dependent protease with chaperone function
MAAWMGLWWSQYPAEIALREQNMLGAIAADLPVYAPPGFRDYFVSNFRLRLLFTVIPVFLIVLLRDVLLLAAGRFGPAAGLSAGALDAASMLVAAGLVFVFAPEILRRVLHTEPLEDGPLRRRLEAMCRRADMRYRDILVWRTHSNMGNAAVMGILPHMRYVLLSDLLLETMTDEQIEAVFAHEMGHVVHRHMLWFVVFFVTAVMAMSGAEYWLGQVAWVNSMPGWMQPVIAAGAFFWVLLLFGFVSRRFERQADVFAARTMQARHAEVIAAAAPMLAAATAGGGAPTPALAGGGAAAAVAGDPGKGPVRSHVGSYGAALFASALQRVAVVNNIPTGPCARWEGSLRTRAGFVLEWAGDLAHNWLHGCIRDRQDYVRRLSADPALTQRFDRFMLHLYATLLFLLCASVTFLFSISR